MRRFLPRDILIAPVIAICALAVYLATLLPDIGGPEDSPKFQFLGYVLGTAHPPGYPLYVLLTHAFVQLPISTIAYRVNLFSAVMAALACGCAYLIARQIGSGRWPAVCAALTLATGLSFWKSAVYAEVYSLAAAMAALTITLLLSWGARHGAKRLLAAVATFALGLGNHLTIVGLLPAGAWYILVRNRKALTLRLVAASITVLLLGVCQYWFIVVRTRQGAPYLESQANSVSDLVNVLTAQRFANERFAFGPMALLTVQMPAVASVIHDEMGTAGILLLGVGVVAAIWRRNAPAILVLGAAAGLLAMVINLTGDIQGFITPVMVLLWPLAALGIHAVVQFFPAPPRRLTARTIALVAVTAMPVASLLANYETSDHSREKGEALFLRSVYKGLPDKAGIIGENYWYDMVLNYLAFTGESGPERGIVRVDSSGGAVREAKSDGRRVFGFAGAATFLGTEGLQVRRAAVEEPTLNDWLRELPRGSVVVGTTALTAVPIEFLPIDRRHAPPLGQPHAFTAFAWVAGQADAIVEVGDAKASLARGDVVATADHDRARVEVDRHNVVEVDEGIALAVFTPRGELFRALEFDAGEPLRVPRLGALYEFTGENPCGEVTTDTWTDITPVVAAGSWVATLDAYGSVVIETQFTGSPNLRAGTVRLMGNGTIRNVSHTRSSDGSSVLVTELVRPSFQRPVFRLSLDERPTAARARLKPGAALTSVTLCANMPAPLFSETTNKAVLRPDFESEPYFGPGWGGPERTNAGTVRRTTGERSTLLLPLDAGYDYRIALNLEADKGTRVTVVANGADVGVCELGDRTPCALRVPRAAVRSGVNSLALSTSSAELAESSSKTLTFRGARLHRSKDADVTRP